MEAIDKVISTMVPLFIDNVDTDQIIPARFLKQTSREGFGQNLFRDWRFDSKDNPVSEFSLNNPGYKGTVLLAGSNFGCGSSREHAAWALVDYGFKAVISTSFADIFKNNALNNGLLPLEVSQEFYNYLKMGFEKQEDTEIHIDLKNQVISLNGRSEYFEINAFKKQCLLKGQDEFQFLVGLREEIAHFEKKELHEI